MSTKCTIMEPNIRAELEFQGARILLYCANIGADPLDLFEIEWPDGTLSKAEGSGLCSFTLPNGNAYARVTHDAGDWGDVREIVPL